VTKEVKVLQSAKYPTSPVANTSLPATGVSDVTRRNRGFSTSWNVTWNRCIPHPVHVSFHGLSLLIQTKHFTVFFQMKFPVKILLKVIKAKIA